MRKTFLRIRSDGDHGIVPPRVIRNDQERDNDRGIDGVLATEHDRRIPDEEMKPNPDLVTPAAATDLNL